VLLSFLSLSSSNGATSTPVPSIPSSSPSYNVLPFNFWADRSPDSAVVGFSTTGTIPNSRKESILLHKLLFQVPK